MAQLIVNQNGAKLTNAQAYLLQKAGHGLVLSYGFDHVYYAPTEQKATQEFQSALQRANELIEKIEASKNAPIVADQTSGQTKEGLMISYKPNLSLEVSFRLCTTTGRRKGNLLEVTYNEWTSCGREGNETYEVSKFIRWLMPQ